MQRRWTCSLYHAWRLLLLQVGLNGVDNGAIRFSHVRVPRVNLLDRFASVDKSGRYSSPLTSEVCWVLICWAVACGWLSQRALPCRSVCLVYRV
jgi:hypothetical protein